MATGAAIESIEDNLLIEILLRLPLKPLMRYKLVSKHWKSLITSRLFCRCYSLLHYPHPNPVSGLLIRAFETPNYDYIPINAPTCPNMPPPSPLKFPGDPFSYSIQNSSNGLLLCYSYMDLENSTKITRFPPRSWYVYNPTSGCSVKLPDPGLTDGTQRSVHGLSLAFDPTESPVYKVVCVRSSGYKSKPFQIEVYSSESGKWSVSGKPFDEDAWFDHGVYWNGSIHWIRSYELDMLYFNLGNEEMCKVLLPDTIYDCEKPRVGYFGESGGHLHVVGNLDVDGKFEIYEMKRDYSEWFVVYQVDMTIGAAYFPEKKVEYWWKRFAKSFYGKKEEGNLENRIRYRHFVLCLVRSNEFGGSFLVVHANGKAIRCNLHVNSFEEISDVGANQNSFADVNSFEAISDVNSFEEISDVGADWFEDGDSKGFQYANFASPLAFVHVETLAGV